MFCAVLSVRSRYEQTIQSDLKKIGVKTYVPLGSKITKPKKKKQPITVSFPVFPGYIFVFVPSRGLDVRAIMGSRGVRRFIYENGSLGRISLEKLRLIQEAEKSGAFDVRGDLKPKNIFKSGEIVQLLGTEYADGIEGSVVEDTLGKPFAVILVGFMKVKISVDFLVRV